MFNIYGGHEKFTQWTKDQKLIMSQLPVGAEVLFYNDPTVDDPLITEVYEMEDETGKTIKVCNVPNIFLTETKTIKVRIPNLIIGRYGIHHKYIGIQTKYFEVEAADKPSDYVYEETETEGSSNSGSTPGTTPGITPDSGGISNENIATNDEVEDLLDDIFGT